MRSATPAAGRPASSPRATVRSKRRVSSVRAREEIRWRQVALRRVEAIEPRNDGSRALQSQRVCTAEDRARAIRHARARSSSSCASSSSAATRRARHDARGPSTRPSTPPAPSSVVPMSSSLAPRVAPATPRALASRASLGGRAVSRAARSSPRPGSRRVALRVVAYEQADTDGEAVKVDIPMADIKRGKKIGSGSFGDVFEGTCKGKPVILKERKMTGPGKKFFDSEAALNRRLKSARGVAPFLGVAGANAYLVWKDEGRLTLDAVLSGGGGGGFFGGGGGGVSSAMNISDESKAVRAFSKQLLQAVKSVHDQGVVHRDVKPDNILFARSGGFGGGKPVVKLIDLGGAADLRVGTNYSSDETVFDPVYGPPEKYLEVKGVGSLFGAGLGWAQAKPDLFDAFSCGMVILQVACPSLRRGKPGGVKRDLGIYGYDAEAWRASLPERRQADFAILDEDGGKGWDLVCGLLAQRKKRTSVSAAIGHPFLRGA